MRAIQIRCPNCGASQDVQATAMTITCSYCQTQSRVRPRTGFFEAPMKLPPQPQLARLPIAVQQHTRRWLVSFSVGMAMFVGLMAIVPMIIVHKVRSATQRAAAGTSHDGRSGLTLNWSSDRPLVADANADNVGDLLGRLRGLDGTDSVHLVAFNGANGAKLWQTRLGTYQETYQGTLALLGPQLLYVSNRGLARGFDIKTGAQTWKVNILEQLESACKAGDSFYLLTADKRWVKLDHQSGKASEVREPAGCVPLATDGHRGTPPGLEVIDDWHDQVPKPRNFDGMYIGTHVIVDGNERLAIGYKSPGTHVPMVARYRVGNYQPPAEEALPEITDDMPARRKRQLRREQREREREMQKLARAATFELVWKAVVPASDPLGASASTPEHFGVSRDADCVVVPYSMQGDKPIHVACLSWKSGEHKWDAAMPRAFIDRIEGLAVSDERAFFSMSSRVHTLDLATGKILFSVGQTNRKR